MQNQNQQNIRPLIIAILVINIIILILLLITTLRPFIFRGSGRFNNPGGTAPGGDIGPSSSQHIVLTGYTPYQPAPSPWSSI